MLNTRRVDTKAPANDVSGIQLDESPSSRAVSVTTPAPPEMPSMYGSARGLRSSTCKSAPAMDNRAPTIKPSTALSARNVNIVFVKVLLSPDRKENSSKRPVSELPVASARTPLSGTSKLSRPSSLPWRVTQDPLK